MDYGSGGSMWRCHGSMWRYNAKIKEGKGG